MCPLDTDSSIYLPVPCPTLRVTWTLRLREECKDGFFALWPFGKMQGRLLCC